MRAFEIAGPPGNKNGIDALRLSERPTPVVGEHDVLINVHASAVNYRDLTTIEDPEPRNIAYPRIPNSDAGGVIIAVGDKVEQFNVGDRVASCFFSEWVDGGISVAAMASALGGARDGVLAEQIVLPESGVIHIPQSWSLAQASTLPCAALTAWHSMFEVGRLRAGDTVLLLGTGGVSIFALQLAASHGIRAIVTSSSDEKLALATSLGAWQTINYKRSPEWQEVVNEMTDGHGVDHCVEVGGAGTVQRSVEAVRVGGSIGMIGVLSSGSLNPTPIMRKSLRFQGIYVGSRAMFANMLQAINDKPFTPLIHQQFAFEDARSAYHTMRAATHTGKLVINVVA
jgi:NADPH:quinone reductase-like Zn-dependent oxidoreductase